MTGRKLYSTFKSGILFISFLFKFVPKFLRILLWDCVSPFSQTLFIGIRYVLLRSLSVVGDNIRIGHNVTIIGWENLKIGNNVSIHSNCYIDASGGVVISDNVSIAHCSSILSSEHTWFSSNIPIKYNDIKFQSVNISEDVWIGCGCRILAGVEIQSRVIVAAGAVVVKNVESNSLVGGVPAKLIKKI